MNEWFEGWNEATTTKEQAAVVSRRMSLSPKAPASGSITSISCDIDFEEVRQTLEASAITGCDEWPLDATNSWATSSRAALGQGLVRDSCI